MKTVTKKDWKIKPLPEEKEKLDYHNFFGDADAEKIVHGFKPRDMDDKWFVYSEDDWVYFVRSWTGHHIFGFRLRPTPAGGLKVIESWVNANPEEYNSPGKEANIEIINRLMMNLFQIKGQA